MQGRAALQVFVGKSAEQPGQKRNQGNADEGHTAPGHELLHALRFGPRVVVAIPFQQVNRAPAAKSGTESNNEGLKDPNSRVKKRHIDLAEIMGKVDLYRSQICKSRNENRLTAPDPGVLLLNF